MTDLIIRGGTIVDGTGAAATTGDVAITDGVITAVGDVSPERRGARTIDADGALVTPGFVDIHTHFDGQATWDPVLAPSSLHGVTTIAMGNCGVGFAPARPDEHDWLIGLLEGVEDIPGTALAEGLTWGWESFPEYLDALERTPHTVDIGVHVAHAALRAYVMGARGADHTATPTADEIRAMAEAVAEAMAAGALGFATSRTEVHRTRDGANIGTLRSGADELLAMAEALRRAGRGVVQLISDCYQTTDDAFADAEFDLIEEIARVSGRPVSFTVQQAYQSPDRFRHLFARVAEANEQSLALRTQVAARPIGVLLGLEATANPFLACPSYAELATLPLAERVTAMRSDDRRRRIVAEHSALMAQLPDGLFRQITGAFDVMFRLSDPVDYELDPASSIAAEAARAGIEPAALAYDVLLADDGRQLLYLPLFNFARHSFDDLAEMLRFRWSLLGLSDAGAHCGAICDASFTTTSLALWGRDRRGGERFPIEWLVHANTQRNARHVGWFDRGVLAPGYLADVNVIDFDALACHPPELVRDLPAGGRRLVQRARGYRATVKRGAITFVDGEHTGEVPGRLLRGDQPAPA
ncbi:MAG TPA: amidohydrolase family protein [Acidimicrobiia bacterium]|nr:amidohydrolase family protein [Acidimicrobiia bacterium]